MTWAELTAGWAWASVASLLALLVSTLTKIISATVYDNGASKNALRADQLDELVGNGALGVALAVGLEIAQVTNVTLVVSGCTVSLAVWVD